MTKEMIAIIALLFTVMGGTVGAVNYFAKADELKQVEYRLDQKIKADKVYYIKRRLWQLYDRYNTENCNQMPQPAVNECRELKAQLESLIKEAG